MQNRLVGSLPRATRVLRLSLAGALSLTSCGAPAIQPAPLSPPRAPGVEGSSIESTEPYRRAGFLVGDGAVPFVGVVRYFATESVDTTLVLVALTLPPRAFSFVRAGDRYAAYYAIKIDFMSGPTLVRSERPNGEVRVASIDETKRGDEGIIFQRSFKIPPGEYLIRVAAQDSLGAGTGAGSATVSVPRMIDGAVAPMLPVFAVEPRSRRNGPLAAAVNARATLRYGRDTALQLYIESYGARAPDTLLITARAESDTSTPQYRSTVILPQNAEVRSTVFSIPTAVFGLGVNRITATSTNGAEAGTVAAMVSVGGDAPVGSFAELLNALKYFATDAELRDLRGADRDRRPSRWAALMRRSDPNTNTAQNEALEEYFRRIRVANARYREDPRPVWETDRGSVIVALGEPDVVNLPVVVDTTGLAHLMTWEYRRHRLLLVFYDQAGNGRWRLTTTSEGEFRSLLSIAGPCVGCR